MALVDVIEEGGVAKVRMNRPDVRNAFNPEMIEEITRLFAAFEKRKDLRVITLSGVGKAFSAGADLSWMKAMVHYSYEQNREDSLRLYAMFDAISACSIPVLGLVHGAAFGGALGLLACCDYVLAETGTQFCFSEAKLGIAPAVISSFVLRKTAAGFARPLMISGRVFDPDEALRMGLVHKIIQPGSGDENLEVAAATWMEAGPQASREIKKLLNDLESLDAAATRERTSKLIAELRVSSEGQEGLKSFLEKRAPSWRDQ